MAKKTDKPLDYTQFNKSLKENKTSPVYIFYGDEEYFISEAIKEVRTYLTDKFGEVEYISHDKSSGSLTELLFNAKSQSLFGSKKLFVFKDCDKLTKEDNKEVDNYINNPGTNTCLILVYNDKKKIKLDSIDNTVLVNFPRDERNIMAQLGKIVENRGYKITKDALSAMVDLTGSSLVDLTNELNKLILFLKDQNQITREDIENYTKRSNYKDIFDLVNAVCNKDIKLALKLLNDMEQKGEEPIAIINRISWRIRLIWQVKQLTDQKLSKSEIMSKLKISSGNLYYIQKQCSNFSYPDIMRAFNNIFTADLKFKSTQIPSYELLSSSIIGMCR